jgi:hypothetical protein
MDIKLSIKNADEVCLADAKARIHAEFIFQELMKHPPEIRKILYQKLINSATDKTA